MQDKISEILNLYNKKKNNNELYSQDKELVQKRKEFQDKFNINILKTKNGEDLLEFLFFVTGKQNSVSYYMEYGLLKQAYFFGTYGGMQCPAILDRNDNWVYKNPALKNKMETLNKQDVLKLAELVKDKIIHIANIIEQVQQGKLSYSEIQKEFNLILQDEKLSRSYMYFRKYLFNLYPEMLSSYINNNSKKNPEVEKLKDYLGINSKDYNVPLIAEKVIYDNFMKLSVNDIFHIILSFIEDNNLGLNYWWINASPKVFEFSKMKESQEEFYTFLNEDGHKRRKFENFYNARPGDKFIGYDAYPIAKIVATGVITKNEEQKLYFKKTKSLKNPIPDSILKHCNELNNMERNGQQGSLFKLTKFEYDFIINLINTNGDENMKPQPLNQILYGPPGTGKTYSIKKYITNIISDNPGLKADNEDQRILDIVKSLNWYSAIALSMYRNGKNNKYKVDNLQHQKLIKTFAQTKENKHVNYTLWGQLQMHTGINSKTVKLAKRFEPFIFNKTEDSEWYLTKEGIKFVEENLSEQLELLDAKNKTKQIEDFYKFITFHQSYSYEEFVEGIKPVINDEEYNTNTISYEYHRGLFKEICQNAIADPGNNYLLIIDEINRGNISKIFGELITLIEEDKRENVTGDKTREYNTIKVTLPYSGNTFSVPNNLYIIGTMNTADRSIALLDTALRRRFDFVEMMPQEELIEATEPNEIAKKYKLSAFLKKLNGKISSKLDDDNYKIGHAYLMNLKTENDLERAICNKIFPLLQEYFYNEKNDLKDIVGYCSLSELKENKNWEKFIDKYCKNEDISA